ncbi:hypothetical protein PHLCEN_2v11837 [Hermanssonia centrifuga]|uniref:Uncharacterized protein n=1 Tax=Hermanssonia centrifuga TaxID=98765 RepID=A0A2R6NIP0_9APHY|nr:hypothetical protein PHLCEN_2v11837 [Hermanssonia centrifuga]
MKALSFFILNSQPPDSIHARASSPSFFNALEAIQVKTYVEQLHANRRVRISESNVYFDNDHMCLWEAPVVTTGEIREASIEDMNYFARMESLILRAVTGNGGEEEDNVDRPWREDRCRVRLMPVDDITRASVPSSSTSRCVFLSENQASSTRGTKVVHVGTNSEGIFHYLGKDPSQIDQGGWKVSRRD